MSLGWQQFTIEEIAASERNAIVGGPFGSNLVSKDYTDNGVPVIRGQNMGGRWVSGTFAFVSSEKAESLSANKARPGDLVFTQRGTLGQVAIVPIGAYQEYIVSQSQMKLTPDLSKVDVEFLYYLFQTEEQQRYIHVNAVQNGVPHTNLTLLRNTPVRLPPLGVQQAIASALKCFDTRIELFAKENETLEAMARAIFKSWFVDFDPVRAKAEGREPEGMDAATAALFPSEFHYSELGPVPKGWTVDSILKVASLLSGGTPKTNREEYWGGWIKWASAKDVSQCPSTFLLETERKITTLGLDESSTKLIPAGCTVVVARGATTGRMVIFGEEMAMNQTCYALSSTTNTPFALYGLFRNIVARLVHGAHGSVFETITTATFEKTQVLIPPAELLISCEALLEPLYSRMLANTAQQSTLIALRDTLLPRLISGKLRVPEAEAMLVEAL